MRLIDADFLKEWVDEYLSVFKKYDKGTIKGFIDHAPTIEPKRGKWIGYNADKGDDWLRSDGEPIFLVCNKCYGTVMNNTSAHWNFCPNCGADMRKGADDE